MFRTTLIALVGVMVLPFTNQAQLFRDQMNDGTGWDVNASGADYAYTFNYDYSADGIPEAPHSQPGDDATRGAKLEANLVDPPSGDFFTLYPVGQNFTGSYQLRFDAWMNLPTSGTTEFMGGGVGYNDTDADLTSGAQAIATGDGGSSQDWRAFNNGTYIPLGNGNAAPYVDFLPAVNGSIAGSPGFQWITWEFNVIGSDVSIFIEKPDQSRLELTNFTPSASTDGNISLFYADFFTSVASPVGAAFGLVDNVVVSNIMANVVNVEATSSEASEAGPTPATFTFSRTATGTPLTVNYTIEGTAENGVDYTNQLGGALTGAISFGASDSTAVLTVVPVDDAISEPEEDIVITTAEGSEYIATGSGTATITDNDTPLLIISADAPSMYERHPSDYASVKITRWGDLTSYVQLDAANFSFSGSAAQGSDYVLNSSVFPVVLDNVDTIVTNFVNPVDNSSYDGNKSIDVSLVAGAGFSISNTMAALTIIDDENPPATVLYSNPLTDAADASNWKLTYANGDTNAAQTDYEASFGYDLTSDSSGGGVIASPPGGATKALRATVNKSLGVTAGLNLYLTNMSFSGDFAVRFNMNIVFDTAPGADTQGPIFGINHDGNQTNWWAGIPSGVVGGPWASDGVWYWISADGGAAAGDYLLYTGAGGQLPNDGWSRRGFKYNTEFAKFFKGVGDTGGLDPQPGPYSQPGLETDGTAGLVSNDAPTFGGDTTTWTDVEIKQMGGVVTLYLNKIPVFEFVNDTTFTDGYIMLGYDDPFDSVGEAAGAVYYANLSVVQLSPPEITDIQRSGSDVTIDFSSNDGTDSTDNLVLEGASVVTGPYNPVPGAVVSNMGGGIYQATATVTADAQFFRISK